MTNVTSPAPSLPRRPIRFNPSRPHGEANYVRAHRHSRFVRWLKILLPIVVVVSVAGFFSAMHFFAVVDNTPAVSQEGIDTHSKSLVMNKPHISGFKGTQWAYEVTADRAIQDISDSKLITLEKIIAQFGTSTAGRATMHAAAGLLDGNANTLALKGGIAVVTDDGYSADLDSAAVDMTAGSLSSSSPILIQSKNGTLRANEIEVTDHGKTIHFSKGVSLHFVPPDDDDSGETAPASGSTAPTGGAGEQ